MKKILSCAITLIAPLLLIASSAMAAARAAPVKVVPRPILLIRPEVSVRPVRISLPSFFGVSLPRGSIRTFDKAAAPLLEQGPVAAIAWNDSLALLPLHEDSGAVGAIVPLSGKGRIGAGPIAMLASDSKLFSEIAAYGRLAETFDGAKITAIFSAPVAGGDLAVSRPDSESALVKLRTRRGIKHLRWETPDPERPVAFSPDGRQVVSAADQNTLRVLDRHSGETKILQKVGKARTGGTPIAHAGDFVTTVVDFGDEYAPDQRLRVWDLKEGRARDLRLPKTARTVTGLEAMSDGRFILRLRPLDLRNPDMAVLDPVSGKIRDLPKSRAWGTYHFVTTRDSKTLIRVQNTIFDGKPPAGRQDIVSYDIATGKIRRVKLPTEASKGDFFLYDVSPDGKYLAMTRGDRVLVVERRRGRIVSHRRIKKGFTLRELRFTKEGRSLSYVVVDDQQVQTDRPAKNAALVRWSWKGKGRAVTTRIPLLSMGATFSQDMRFASDRGFRGIDIYDYE